SSLTQPSSAGCDGWAASAGCETGGRHRPPTSDTIGPTPIPPAIATNDRGADPHGPLSPGAGQSKDPTTPPHAAWSNIALGSITSVDAIHTRAPFNTSAARARWRCRLQTRVGLRRDATALVMAVARGVRDSRRQLVLFVVGTRSSGSDDRRDN